MLNAWHATYLSCACLVLAVWKHGCDACHSGDTQYTCIENLYREPILQLALYLCIALNLCFSQPALSTGWRDWFARQGSVQLQLNDWPSLQYCRPCPADTKIVAVDSFHHSMVLHSYSNLLQVILFEHSNDLKYGKVHLSSWSSLFKHETSISDAQSQVGKAVTRTAHLQVKWSCSSLFHKTCNCRSFPCWKTVKGLSFLLQARHLQSWFRRPGQKLSFSVIMNTT